ncbi:hypothetical protein GW17_00048607 [Ensete ventricosum]|nr:hypothetical protein GW17_00048607 [Ensete ventricosum]
MQLGTRLECVESSSRVSRAYQDGVREFAGRRSRLVRRLSGVAERLAGSWKDLEVDLWPLGPRREFPRRFTKGIGKLAGNMLGDCQKKTKRLIVRMSEAARLAGRPQGAAPRPGLTSTRATALARVAPAQGDTAREAAAPAVGAAGVQHRRLRRAATTAAVVQ